MKPIILTPDSKIVRLLHFLHGGECTIEGFIRCNLRHEISDSCNLVTYLVKNLLINFVFLGAVQLAIFLLALGISGTVSILFAFGLDIFNRPFPSSTNLDILISFCIQIVCTLFIVTLFLCLPVGLAYLLFNLRRWVRQYRTKRYISRVESGDMQVFRSWKDKYCSKVEFKTYHLNKRHDLTSEDY